MKSKQIQPYQAYSLLETAELLDVHPSTLREKLSEKDPLIVSMNPNKVGREWRFLGENILRSLGSVTYTGEQSNQTNSQTTAGAAPVK